VPGEIQRAHRRRHLAVDGRPHGEEEWLRVLALWSTAALDLDERLDVQPDWGEW
jgi:hypothetical protein